MRAVLNFIRSMRINIEKSKSYIKSYGFISFLKKVKEKILISLKDLGTEQDETVPATNLINLEPKEIRLFKDATVSIIIPTKNAGTNFNNLLALLKNQQGFIDLEIIVVDSGSTDETLKISRQYGAKIIEITPDRFSHSYSRNLGAENARGNYLLFTVQDALPASDLWLYKLFSSLKNSDKRVAAASCAESPGKNTDLFYKVISWHHHRFLGVDKNDRIFSLPPTKDHVALRKNGNLHNAACLIPKKIFMKYKFRYNYAEDLDLGIRLIQDGYKLAFLSSAKIIHAHNREAYYFLKRSYVENISFPLIFQDFSTPAVELDFLIKDMFFTYDALNSLARGDFLQANEAAHPEQIFNALIRELKKLADCNYSTSIALDHSYKYMDPEFKLFLKGIYPLYSVKENISYDGNLVIALIDFLNIVLEYIENSCELMDDLVLEDFMSCIYKAFASRCGDYLAFSYLTNPGNIAIKGINNELLKGV